MQKNIVTVAGTGRGGKRGSPQLRGLSPVSRVSMSSASSWTHTLGACVILLPCVGALEEAPNPAVYPKTYFKTFQGIFSVGHSHLAGAALPVAVVRTLPGEMLMT